MSIEQRKMVWDVVKIIIGISLAINSFVIANTYTDAKEQLHNISDQLHNVETRLIRVEYELKLK